MTTTVTFGGVSFSNQPTPDADGCLWVLESLTGWDDGLSVRGRPLDRPAGHGDFAERAWRGGRLPVVAGSVLCPSRSVAASVKRSLAALLADGTFTDLTVDDVDAGALSCEVRLGAQPTVDWGMHPSVVRCQFPLYAADPLRYGTLVTAVTGFPVRSGGLRFPLYSDGAGGDVGALYYGESSGSTGRALLANEGTADTWPQFVITGPVDSSGFEIVTVGTGARLRFSASVPAGSQLVLDAATGSAVIDGTADRGGRLTWRDWAPIPAGGSSEFAFVPLGATSEATLTVTARPAFW